MVSSTDLLIGDTKAQMKSNEIILNQIKYAGCLSHELSLMALHPGIFFCSVAERPNW